MRYFLLMTDHQFCDSSFMAFSYYILLFYMLYTIG